MNPFGYERAEDVARAVAAVGADPRAAFLGGGTNLVDHIRLGVANPALLVDVSCLPMDRVEPVSGGGLRIGAAARNSDVAAHPLVRRRCPVLTQALLSGASPQLRGLATIGGNLLQRTRCVYFRDVAAPCNKRTPGSGCSALRGYHRHHAVLGASEHCVAVHPSDMAVALVAVDAVVHVTGPRGDRTIPVVALHRLPGDDPRRDTVLDHGELITAVELPGLPLAARSRYRKVRDRATYAFALVSVAAVVAVDDSGAIRDVRIAFGGVAHKPWRAYRAEEELRGVPAAGEEFARAVDRAATAELATARPLRDNAFKLPMVRGALLATLRDLTREVR